MTKRPRLTEDDLDTLTSYADGESRVRKQYKLSLVQLKEAALDQNVEKCPSCGWWAESSEMIPDGADDPDGHCCNCRSNKS